MWERVCETVRCCEKVKEEGITVLSKPLMQMAVTPSLARSNSELRRSNPLPQSEMQPHSGHCDHCLLATLSSFPSVAFPRHEALPYLGSPAFLIVIAQLEREPKSSILIEENVCCCSGSWDYQESKKGNLLRASPHGNPHPSDRVTHLE